MMPFWPRRLLQIKGRIRLPVGGLMVLYAVLLSGCATTKMIQSADEIQGDNKSNTVFLGFDVEIPDSRIRDVNFICENRTTGKIFHCFYLNRMDSVNISGAKAYRMQFGDYRLTELRYQYESGSRLEERCYTGSKGKRFCRLIRQPYYQDELIETGFDHVFSVTKDFAPYLGHFTIRTSVDSSKEAFALRVDQAEIKQRLEEDLQGIYDVSLRHAIANHVSPALLP